MEHGKRWSSPVFQSELDSLRSCFHSRIYLVVREHNIKFGFLPIVVFTLCAQSCCMWKPSPNERAVASRQVLEASSEAESRGDVQEAQDLLSDAISRNPEAAEHHFQLAQLLVRQNNHSQAFRHLHECTQLDPDDPRSYRELGRLMVRHGNLTKAEEFIQKALANNPMDADALAIRAEIHHRSGESDKALNDVLMALSITPNSTSLTKRAADYYAESGNHSKASEILRRAERRIGLLKGERTELLWKLGETYMAQNRWDDSVKAFEKAVHMGPEPTESQQYMLAYSQLKAGNEAEARMRLENLLERNPQNNSALHLYASISNNDVLTPVSATAENQKPTVFRLATQRQQD